MADKNTELQKWNESLVLGEDTLSDMRKRAIAKKHGLHRRLLLRLIRFMERWIERGKRWRDDDIFGE